MSYRLDTPLAAVKGVGPQIWQCFEEINLKTVQDLLLFIPLRYEDRSQRATIASLVPNELVTLAVEVINCRTYYKGRRTITNAKLKDETGQVSAMWFNNRFIQDKLKTGQTYLFSGKLNDRGILLQPVVEDLRLDTIHTDRLVPRYSSIPGIKEGSLRRLLKHLLDEFQPTEDHLSHLDPSLMSLGQSLAQLHFPDGDELVVKARERLAVEELLSLIQRSNQLRKSWQAKHDALALSLKVEPTGTAIPHLPFTLTAGQQQALNEILSDIQKNEPMNRLLVGDVGSGKTVVAGIAAQQAWRNGFSSVLVAPTRILAEQHAQSIQKLLPELPIQLLTSATKKVTSDQPTFYVGTHAAINRLAQIRPALVIYDEQHRFGVKQRSQAAELDYSPHILTMSATPIPRSLMLTIFAHLQLSTIDELPAGRLPVKTWVVPPKKRADGYHWVAQELQTMSQVTGKPAQAFVVCPFIDPSQAEALENVAAVTKTFEELSALFKERQSATPPKLALLHGKMAKTDQNQIVDQLRSGEFDILVTTPIVEVGIDVPTANIIVIEAAERFGLASLHQLRGRVGRAGQQAYCLLLSHSQKAQERLDKFSQINKGSELAELDLQYRGAGDIFGTSQHGFDELRFANWADVELIHKAKQLFEKVQAETKTQWQPLFKSTSASEETLTIQAN